VAFEQATIRVEKEKEFAELKGALQRVLAPQAAEKFLRQLEKSGTRVRDFDKVLTASVIERADGEMAKGDAKGLYAALTVSDQAQIREFYLSLIEDVQPELRTKFQKLYRYY
jgi:hypothetical protein